MPSCCSSAARAELVDAITWALDRGARRVVLTLGADGAVLATRDDIVHVPAREVTVRDTTGCGDAVVGGLLAALLAGYDDAGAVELGVVAGSTNAAGDGLRCRRRRARRPRRGGPDLARPPAGDGGHSVADALDVA